MSRFKLVANSCKASYARSERTSPIPTVDIWRTHDGRLLMRCWSRCEDIDWCSFKIKGVDLAEIPEINKSAGFQDSWVPSAARQAYERWIDEES